MADMFAPLVAQLKANPKTIVFTEGNDPRILEAASKLLAEGVLKVVMVGNEAECKAAAAAGNFDISAAEIIDPENYAGFDEMVNTMVELRKGKQTAEECTALLKKSNYFGTMLVKMGKADCLLGGATYSTADTVRPALQLIKTRPGSHLVSSCFILEREGELLLIGEAVSIGYLNRPELNAKAFFTAPDGRRGYHTGDLCRMRDGCIYYLGRLDGQVKLNGFRVELEDVENNLVKVPNIARAAVLPVMQDGKVTALTAFVLLEKPDGESSLARARRIKAALGELLPAYMIPRKILAVDAFPLNTNGKIDKKQLSARRNGRQA